MNVVHKLVHLNKFMNLEGSGSVFKYKNTATLRLLPPVLINPPGALPAGASIPLHHRPLSLIFKIRVRHPQLLHKQERCWRGCERCTIQSFSIAFVMSSCDSFVSAIFPPHEPRSNVQPSSYGTSATSPPSCSPLPTSYSQKKPALHWCIYHRDLDPL